MRRDSPCFSLRCLSHPSRNCSMHTISSAGVTPAKDLSPHTVIRYQLPVWAAKHTSKHLVLSIQQKPKIFS